MFQLIPITPYGDRLEGGYRQPDAHYWCLLRVVEGACAMSLLYRGRETVTIYHAEEWISEDGNIMYRPSTTDVEVLQ